MGFYACIKFFKGSNQLLLNNATNEVGKYNDIANMFILICLRNNFCFLVGDPDVGTVAPDLIKIQAGHNDNVLVILMLLHPILIMIII